MNRIFLSRIFSLPFLTSIISLANVFLAAPNASGTENFAIQTRLNTGVMYYEFEQQGLFSQGERI